MSLSKKDKERATELETWAKQHGFDYEAKDSYGIRAYFKDMKLFRMGGQNKCLNMMQKKDDEYNYGGIFDYFNTVSTGKSTYTFKQTVYFRIHNALMLPEFRLLPEKWYHQVSKWFGMQDINYVQYPEFSRNYLLQGPQPDFIWRLFQDEQILEHFRTNTGWSVEAVGRYFVMYQMEKIQPLNDMRKFLRTGDKLYKMLLDRNTALEAIFEE